MLQIHTYSFKNIYRPYDLQGTFMPSAGQAEWLISTCLTLPLTEGKGRLLTLPLTEGKGRLLTLPLTEGKGRFQKAGSSGYLGPGAFMRILV